MKIKNSLLFFYLGYAFMYIGILVEHTAIIYAQQLKLLLYISSILFICIGFFSEKIYILKLQRYDIFLSALLVIMLSILTKDFYILMIMFLGFEACSLSDRDVKKLLRISIVISCCFLIIIPFLCFLDIIPNLNSIRGIGEEPRYARGFNHSQVCPIIITYMFLMYFTIKKRVRFIDFIITEVISFIIYQLFDARNAIITIQLFFVLYFLSLNYYKFIIFNKNNLLKLLSKYSMFISCIISYVLLILYNNGNKIAIIIDELISHRIREPISYFKYGFSDYIFNYRSYNNYYSILNSVNKNIDNSIFYITIRYGIIFLIAFCIFYKIIVNYFINDKNKTACIILFTIAISIMITNSLTSYFLPFLIIGAREVWIINIKSRGALIYESQSFNNSSCI